ncbi:MAG: hypothetical protein AAF221_00200 [Pseudomonadota bacterium]
MEGNLSLKEAHASVSAQDDGDHSAQDAPESGAWETSTTRRKRLLRMATFCTGLWLGLFVAGLFWAHSVGQMETITPAHVAVFITAAGVPLCLIWIVSLVLQRADPLLERRLAIARTLNSTIAPVDAAEVKLDKMLERLRRDIGTVDQTVMLANERIGALEDRFKDQVSELFSATTDAEAKSASIREQLKRERESMEGLTELLENHLGDIRTTMADATDSTIQAEMKSRDAFKDAATTFEDQYTRLINASGTAVDGISTVMNGLAERTTALDAAALAATQKLGKGVSALKAHEDDYRGFVDKFAEDFASFDSTVDARLVTLDAAQTRLTRSNETVFAQLLELGQKTNTSVDEALSRALASSDALAEHQQNVEDTSAHIVAALTDQQTAAQKSADQFAEQLFSMKQALDTSIQTAMDAQQTASETFESVLGAHVLSWQKALGQFSQSLTHQTERAGSIAASRLLKAGETIQNTVSALHTDTDTRIREQSGLFHSLAEEINQKLSEAGTQTGQQVTALQGQIAELDEQRTHLRDVADALKEDIASVPDVVAANVSAVRDTLTLGQQALEDSMSRLEGSAQQLSALPATIAQAWAPELDKVKASFDAIESDQRKRLDSLSDAAASIEERCKDSLSAIDAQFEQVKTQQHSTDHMAQTLHAKIGGLQEALQEVQKGLAEGETQVNDLTGQFETIQSLADDISKFDSNAIGALPDQWNEQLKALTRESEALNRKAQDDSEEIVEKYKSALSAAGTLTQGLSEKLEATMSSITKDADKAVDLARLKWAALSEDRQSTALGAVERFSQTVSKTLNERSSEIESQLAQLETLTRTSLDQLQSDTREKVKTSEETLQRVKALTKRINEDKGADLIKSSSLIIDALHSSSIDLSKSMGAGLSDEDWTRYLAGDKSLFTRRTAEMLSKSERDAIRKKLERDQDLKQASLHYLKDFELLMSRAMAGGEPTSLSIALISSDIGKLYVALSQAIRRMN